MSQARYVIALLVLMSLPGGILYWFSVHPFIRFWRRIGLRKALAINWSLIFVFAWLVYWQRRFLLSLDFGDNPFLFATGLALLVAGAALKRKVGHQLSYKILIGLPELDPSRPDNRLLTEGIYARIRHPRYLQLLVLLLGYSLMANYAALYVAFVLAVPAIYLLALLEERELRQRFGQDYEAYCRRTPRFVPRVRRRR